MFCFWLGRIYDAQLTQCVKACLKSAKLHSKKLSQCCSNAFQKHWNYTLTICLEVILQTRDIVHWGFSDSSMQFRCYIQAVIVFQGFFLQPTQQASLHYFRKIYIMWFLPQHLCHNDFTFQKFWAFIDDTLLVPNKSHVNRW